MKQNQEGPYKHYQRPTESRTVTFKSGNSKRWVVVMILLVVILIVLVPVVHHLASSEKTNNQAIELRKSTKKGHAKIKKKAAATSPKKQTGIKQKTKALTKPKTQVKPKVKKATKPKQYVVQDGDSLTSIAEKFDMSVAELAEKNQLSPSSQVNIGQKLQIR